jgi:hypothetical protein
VKVEWLFRNARDMMCGHVDSITVGHVWEGADKGILIWLLKTWSRNFDMAKPETKQGPAVAMKRRWTTSKVAMEKNPQILLVANFFLIEYTDCQ